MLCQCFEAEGRDVDSASISLYLASSAALYAIGIYCLVAKRNMVRLLLSLEVMLNGVNLAIIAFSSHASAGFTHPLGHALAVISIGVGGCLIAVGLAITLKAYKHYKTLDIRELRRLRH